jgi:hypothetical protein
MKFRWTIAAAVALALTASLSTAQPGFGPGAGKAPGAGPQGGPRAPAFGPRYTQGWSMMSAEERNAHRDRMLAAKTVDECKAALDEQRRTIEARAKERGVAVPRGPRTDMCQIMQRRGRFG